MNGLDPLLGVYYSLLPRPFWGKWKPSSTVTFVHSAMLSGLAELFVCGAVLIRGGIHFLIARSHQLTPLGQANEGTQLYFGGILLLEYVFQPLSILLLCGMAEGAIRWFAAWSTEEILPSMPLKLAWLIREWHGKREQERRLGPIVPDVMERADGGEYAIRISACRPKEGWREFITVAVDGELYELIKVRPGMPPHRFEYLLRKFPVGKVIRGIYRYEPQSVRNT